MNLTDEALLQLADLAWESYDRAYSLGRTKVGAAVLCEDFEKFGGCNVEHRYRCHDIHAEINAISTMVAAGHTKLIALVVVSDRKHLSPCGGCLDWILQFGGSNCLVAWQSQRGDEITVKTAGELMPCHPFYD
jgi:cytidine deaminase